MEEGFSHGASRSGGHPAAVEVAPLGFNRRPRDESVPARGAPRLSTRGRRGAAEQGSRLGMPTLVTGIKNLHTIYRHGQRLGVECTSCGHRALAYEGKVDELRADMR